MRSILRPPAQAQKTSWEHLLIDFYEQFVLFHNRVMYYGPLVANIDFFYFNMIKSFAL